jgi:hypothetical protein
MVGKRQTAGQQVLRATPGAQTPEEEISVAATLAAEISAAFNF